MNERQRGILKTYDPLRGFGFITREKGKDVFIFYTDFENTKMESTAVVGSILEFNVEKTQKGYKAKNVTVIS